MGTRLHRTGADELAPQLRDEERVPSGQVLDRTRELEGRLDAGRQADELRDLAAGEPPEAQANDTFRPVDVDEGLCKVVLELRLRVAERRDEQHPGVGARTDQVPHQQQGRRIGPVHVLEDEQERRLGADRHEQVRHRGMETVPFRVGVRRRPLRQLADP